MTTKHTPGPWAVDDDGDVCISDLERLIAAVDRRNVTLRKDEAAANAALIAAAPDLLAACEALAEAQQRADAGEHVGFGLYVDAVDAARAAIAKAKGETK